MICVVCSFFFSLSLLFLSTCMYCMGSLPDFKINGWNGMNGWMDLHSKLSRTTTNYLRRGGYVFIGVSLFVFVYLFARLRTNYSTDFHKIWWNGGTWAKKIICQIFVVNVITSYVRVRVTIRRMKHETPQHCEYILPVFVSNNCEISCLGGGMRSTIQL